MFLANKIVCLQILSDQIQSDSNTESLNQNANEQQITEK
jgi:hypothetical protein